MIQGVITGYTLYVNGKVWGIYDTAQQAYKEASRYSRWNVTDIQPMWKFIEGEKDVNRAA